MTGRPEHLKTFVLSFSSFSEMRASPCRPLLTSSVSGVSRKLQHEQPTKKMSKIVRIGEKAGEKNLDDITTNKRLLKKSGSWQVAKIQKEKDQNGQITVDRSDGAHLVCFSGSRAAPARL